MSSPITIRRLVESDLSSILTIAASADEAPNWPRETFIEMLSGQFSTHRIALVAAEPGSDKAMGFVIASFVPPEAELEAIAVAESCQRQCIGRRLLSGLVSGLRYHGIDALHLEVRASNRAAIGLYNSFGFNESGRRPRYYSNPIEDAVLMTLKFQ
jgi:[ribosomal protein S18]-alanine N-acetyltransferase